MRFHSRGFLPHFEGRNLTQFVTWRLGDSLPAEILGQWKEELNSKPNPAAKSEWQSRIEGFLDAGHGSQILKNIVAAGVVQEALIFGHPREYYLHAWVVMPTHVHVLLRPDGRTLSQILHRLKGFTSKEINRRLGRAGRLWQPDYFDRWIRDPEHFDRVAAYIEGNPVKAKLCERPKDWAFSSANEHALNLLKRE